jgi:hypothetical protein
LGLACVVVIGILITNYIKEKELVCKNNDCRSAQEQLEQAKTDEEVLKICETYYRSHTIENAPKKCIKAFKLE